MFYTENLVSFLGVDQEISKIARVIVSLLGTRSFESATKWIYYAIAYEKQQSNWRTRSQNVFGESIAHSVRWELSEKKNYVKGPLQFSSRTKQR